MHSTRLTLKKMTKPAGVGRWLLAGMIITWTLFTIAEAGKHNALSVLQDSAHKVWERIAS